MLLFTVKHQRENICYIFLLVFPLEQSLYNWNSYYKIISY